MSDLIDRQAAIDALHMHLMYRMGTDSNKKRLDDWINGVPSAQPDPNCSEIPNNSDTISRQAAIETVRKCAVKEVTPAYMLIDKAEAMTELMMLPSAQTEIIRCKDCEYGEQDEVGRWFCRSLGCQIGNEDGSGFCADAERRTDD